MIDLKKEAISKCINNIKKFSYHMIKCEQDENFESCMNYSTKIEDSIRELKENFVTDEKTDEYLEKIKNLYIKHHKNCFNQYNEIND